MPSADEVAASQDTEGALDRCTQLAPAFVEVYTTEGDWDIASSLFPSADDATAYQKYEFGRLFVVQLEPEFVEV